MFIPTMHFHPDDPKNHSSNDDPDWDHQIYVLTPSSNMKWILDLEDDDERTLTVKKLFDSVEKSEDQLRIKTLCSYLNLALNQDLCALAFSPYHKWHLYKIVITGQKIKCDVCVRCWPENDDDVDGDVDNKALIEKNQMMIQTLRSINNSIIKFI